MKKVVKLEAGVNYSSVIQKLTRTLLNRRSLWFTVGSMLMDMQIWWEVGSVLKLGAACL